MDRPFSGPLVRFGFLLTGAVTGYFLARALVGKVETNYLAAALIVYIALWTCTGELVTRLLMKRHSGHAESPLKRQMREGGGQSLQSRLKPWNSGIGTTEHLFFESLNDTEEGLWIIVDRSTVAEVGPRYKITFPGRVVAYRMVLEECRADLLAGWPPGR